jgi:hypothetical protein
MQKLTQDKSGKAADPTPEMIQAGLDVLCRRCPDTAVGDSVDEAMVAEIYRAMVDHV